MNHTLLTVQAIRASGLPLLGWVANHVYFSFLDQGGFENLGVNNSPYYIGQIAASAGFVAYSWLLDNLVFIVTNSLLLLTGIFGQYTYLRARRKAASKGSAR